MVLARESSGATFAESGCATRTEPLTQQGFNGFGAGKQWCDIR